MMNSEKPARRDVLRSIAFSIVFSLVTAVGGVFLIPYAWPLGAIIWGFLFVAGIFFLVRWHAGSFGYRCLKCNQEFEISMLRDMISWQSPFSGGWKYLRCPRCDQWSRAMILKKKKD